MLGENNESVIMKIMKSNDSWEIIVIMKILMKRQYIPDINDNAIK